MRVQLPYYWRIAVLLVITPKRSNPGIWCPTALDDIGVLDRRVWRIEEREWITVIVASNNIYSTKVAAGTDAAAGSDIHPERRFINRFIRQLHCQLILPPFFFRTQQRSTSFDLRCLFSCLKKK